MAEKKISPQSSALIGELEVPGDKSISHRAVIFGSLAKGQTKIDHFLDGEDCLRTVDAFRQMGVDIEQQGESIVINSGGAENLIEPKVPLYFGNSGTTARLMIGLLSGLPLFTTIYGDASLSERPMDRVVLPLSAMNAAISGRSDAKLLPLAINGKELQAIQYTLPVKSAQVKSALLFAGLFANGETVITEKAKTRNHTETMLEAFGAELAVQGNTIRMNGKQALKPVDIYVPGDISSAAFFLAAAAAKRDSSLVIKKVGLNPTRTGIIDVLTQMGAQIEISNKKRIGGELLGDVKISSSSLIGIEISGDIIPRLIDEIPIIALLATQAEGRTVIKDAAELRVKETDRIAAVVEVLTTLGASVTATEDGMIIEGNQELTGGNISAYHDHRMAMMGAIASFFTTEDIVIDDISSIAISYPSFFEDLKKITTN
ncbi:3-phosphoshikimate 1-carboxyvinyltransferase [Oceanobacillus alkalisoli]|uniref:3-phosphoshikimate 1-carboxyvinyltransferase n=1 Tax=Oceanobacillus alkalisoli TaxID=2925113 RepID=UPI001EF1183E|nr:3-phosphoshikimate 1-carboxyvinyltransferase [Oceanobacillus alkalisoli]MCF3941634.1 3-phosphoshikimate 1-carboxyvinyltransferase [Oceanobacillus alkalisoli]MCG5102916.1 3-phosphoshikimate 1-carboxyvinyltransferase [Oceanobacillus alkalisoli]